MRNCLLSTARSTGHAWSQMPSRPQMPWRGTVLGNRCKGHQRSAVHWPGSMQPGDLAHYFWLSTATTDHSNRTMEDSMEDREMGQESENKLPKLARLEAVLFLAQEPLSTRKLAKLADLADGTEARTLVGSLQQQYNRRGSAMQIAAVAGGMQLVSRSLIAPWLSRLIGTEEEPRLSVPAMETLSVVAYRQPILRAEVEAIRGVQCGEILRLLLEREFLRIVGRSEQLGRPMLYGTTKYFLQIFGLRRLEDLPSIDENIVALKN